MEIAKPMETASIQMQANIEQKANIEQNKGEKHTDTENLPSPTDLVKILLGETPIEDFKETITHWVNLEDE